MSFVPSDDMFLKEIVNIQQTQGRDYLKAEQPLWMFGLKRLRAIRKAHNLAPSPPESKSAQETKSESSKSTNNPHPNFLKERIHLTFTVSDGKKTYPYKFDEPFLRVFCEPGFDKETTFAILERTLDHCKGQIIISRVWKCAYCGERATWLYCLSPLVDLDARPPMVVCNWCRPLCEDNTECHESAHKESTIALKNMLVKA